MGRPLDWTFLEYLRSSCGPRQRTNTPTMQRRTTDVDGFDIAIPLCRPPSMRLNSESGNLSPYVFIGAAKHQTRNSRFKLLGPFPTWNTCSTQTNKPLMYRRTLSALR